MDTTQLHFYPGSSEAAQPMPLARYLPPLPPGMVTTWLAENAAPGSWVLDPLGASPAMALEAARAGYRVLVASNNPIVSFLIETLASAPKRADFQSALAELADTRRGEERLETHIRHLYHTECPTCGEVVTAQGFLWRKGEDQPFARVYDCLKCGENREQPVTQADLDRLKAMGGDKLQRSRALQRVIMNEEEHRADVEEALESYLPRPLYALFTLANKVEGLGLPPARARLLQALLISAFDAGNTLWPPGGRARPKQLIVPTQFRENNVWQALEAAVDEWANQPGPLPVTRWPEQPPASGGICLFRGRVKALLPLPKESSPAAVLTIFPRPNQAFWTLSVLWAGWLWGPEAALPLRNVLDRRRYDWNWHTSAIHAALAAVGGITAPEIPCFGILPELVPGFLSAVLVAAESGGFRLDGLALRVEQEVAQGLWHPTGEPPASDSPAHHDEAAPRPETTAAKAEALESAAREAMRADLLARNEPAPYLAEYAAGLVGLVRAGAAPRSASSIPGDLLTRLQAVVARTFADRGFLRRYGPAEEERGAWWLAGQTTAAPESGAEANLPLADRVEMEVVRYLQKHPAFTLEELDQALCAQFTGLLTPPIGLVRACLESYGEAVPSQPGYWRIRSSESAAARKVDLYEMRSALETVGQRLGCRTTERETSPGAKALVWERADKKGGAGEWWFYRMASSILSRYVLAGVPAPGHSVLVLPGSRAHLLSYKLKRDPRMEEATRGWRFLKFRHLREITAETDLPPTGWEDLLDKDPLTDQATQMELFENL